jgi:hypothetical protein
MQQAADQYRRHGGIMRIRRAIIPVILALGVAGSILAGSAAPAAVAQGHATHSLATSNSVNPDMFFRE